MQRGAIAIALVATLGLGACTCKKKAGPSKTSGAGSGSQVAIGPTVVVPPPKPRGPNEPTAPDTTYEERRKLLLQRGSPEMMKDAPVATTTAPEVKPEQLIKPLGKDLLQVGTIKVDLAKGRAEVAAKVGATTEPLEYVAVATNGKAYESLFTIDTNAVELRLALSLMGYEGTMPEKNTGNVTPATDEDTVFLAAIVGGKERPVAAYLIDKKTKKAPKDIPWQVIGFQPEDRDQALLTKDLFTLVQRDRHAPVRYSVDPGNSYAGPNEGMIGNPKLLPADAAVTLVIKRNPKRPAPPPMPDITRPDAPMPIPPPP
jgi:hypothetical protein